MMGWADERVPRLNVQLWFCAFLAIYAKSGANSIKAWMGLFAMLGLKIKAQQVWVTLAFEQEQ
jgi:hypothetical protein